jgi:tRNA(Ile)-lysidine synthase
VTRKERTLEQRVVGLILEHNLIAAGEKLVVAVSGGADSVCMLHVLAQHQRGLGVELHVAHLDHRLRGAESDSDASYISDLADKLDLPVTIGCRDVMAYRDEQGGSLEEAAREVRYSFLAEVAVKIGTTKVAVGHTRDDQVETILMHLLRGAGLAGLRGLQPRSLLKFDEEQVEVVRPLLVVTRQETWDYCQRYNLQPRTDSSNESIDFLRNRVRRELLPQLKNYNPSIDKALLRLATLAGDDVLFIEQQASRLWREVATEENDVIYLDLGKINGLPRAMQRQMFRLSIAGLAGSLKDFEAEHIESMMDFLSKPAGRSLYLPHGLTLSTEYGRLVLASAAASSCPFPPLEASFHIHVPGETRLPGWQVKAEVFPSVDDNVKSGFAASFDLDKAGRKLMVRQRLRGDRFQPLGMNQTKKLQDFMVDARIPRSWRGRIPLVCSPEQILWVVGWRIDDRVKVTEATKNVLRLEFCELA